MMLALGAGAATACSLVLGIDEPEVVPTILGAGADAASDGAGRDALVDAAADALPFCPRDASFCADFTSANFAIDWNDTPSPTLGQLERSGEGATEPGSLQVTVPQFTGTQNRTGIYLRRRIDTLRGERIHFEGSVRFDAIPEQGDTAPFGLTIGNALFYLYFTQTGWRVDDLYYCDGGCTDGQHRGTQAATPLHTWERISLDIELGDAGRFVATFTASPSNERLSFSLDPQFSASPRFDSYLAAGVAAASPATTDRKILIDDIALTVR